MYRIESLLSARQFLVPQLAGEYIYFVSNMSGRLSLYRMKKGGSLPEPLLPPEIALQNPHLIEKLYCVFPDLGKIVIMIDQDGNEEYKPMTIPLDGGYPENLFLDGLEEHRYFLDQTDLEKNMLYLNAASHKEALNFTYQIDLRTGEKTLLHESGHWSGIGGTNEDHSRVIVIDEYTFGDVVMFSWVRSAQKAEPIYGIPLKERSPDFTPVLNSISATEFVRNDSHLIFHTTLFEDAGGLGWLDLAHPEQVHPGTISGIQHNGSGEFVRLQHLNGSQYLAFYNIDGSDWVYEGTLDEDTFTLNLKRVLVGQDKLSDGVFESFYFEEASGNFSLSFSTATSPTQIYTIEGAERKLIQQTFDKLLGLPEELLSKGEDYPFTSHDGLRCSARLYLPSEALGFEGARPLIYYVHGGPQSQERPDFAWFSMPLIQFLTLKGFAVFVPNVRGSSGYGLSYRKKVDNDWGGQDRLDHVHAMIAVLPQDSRLDANRAAVVGRSYGGFMTMTLAARHPELWKASCEMFGPYDLFTFIERLPETWKPYFYLVVGHPDKDQDFLEERSPRAYIEDIEAPMLVIQGKNDPRVIEQESRDLVERLNSIGKEVEYLMFENEGHDVIKFENKVKCYNAITDFFAKHLNP